MKKIALIVTLVMMSAAGVNAQDTLNFNVPPSNYFYNKWITDYVDGFSYYVRPVPAIVGKYCYTDTALTIYGIATALWLEPAVSNFDPYEQTQDTSRKHAFEKVAIYYPPCDTMDRLLMVSEEKVIHIFDSTPAYYMHLDFDANPEVPGYESEGTKPVFEVYFENPVEVTDSFYVGVTFSSVFHEVVEPGHVYLYNTLPVCQYNTHMNYEYYYDYYLDTYPDDRVIFEHAEGSIWGTEYHRAWGCVLSFPILTPKAVDTTGSGTVDTLSLSQVLTDRYIKVLPNPATDKVQVVSSYGMKKVEVYNTAGQKVMEREAKDYTATFDITSLPAGSYVMKIHTVAGLTSKKLIVQR